MSLPRQVAKLPIPWVLYHPIHCTELALHIDNLMSQLSPSESSHFGLGSDHISAPLMSPFILSPVSDVHHFDKPSSVFTYSSSLME
jgi:hypothetical protein